MFLSCYTTNNLLFSSRNMLNNERCLEKGTQRVHVPAACCFCLCTQPWLETRECQACLVDKHWFFCQMKLCGCRNSVRICFAEGKYTHWIPAVWPHSRVNASALPGVTQRENTGPQATGPISVLNQTDLDFKSKGVSMYLHVPDQRCTWTIGFVGKRLVLLFCLCLCRCVVQLHD